MNAREVVEAILNLIEVLTRWTIILLFIVLMFRKQIVNLLPALADRVSRISVGGNTVDFISNLKDLNPELRETFIEKVRPDPLEGENYDFEEGAVSQEAGVDEATDTTDSESEQMEQDLNDLRSN